MDFETVMKELKALSNERLKKIYLSNGAREPLFGVATGAMKPLAKKIRINQDLAEKLYSTGNYDAMYFAGIIADPKRMNEADYERWIDGAYFYMLSDAVVSVTLSESDIAQEIADKWIASGDELRMSAGYSCYCWLLGNRNDSEFSKDKLANMLDIISDSIHYSQERVKSSMNNFIYTVGVSYLPLHEKALEVAKAIGLVEVKRMNKKPILLHAYESIQKDVEKGRIGFKRKYVRC